MPDAQGYYLSPADYQIWQDMKAWFLRNEVQHANPIPMAGPGEEYSETVLVQVTSAISGQGGRYDAKLIGWGANAAASGNLASTDLGPLASAENCIVWNIPEAGSPTHVIDTSNAANCVFFGHLVCYDHSSGKAVIAINANGFLSAVITAATATNGAIQYTYTIQFGYWDMSAGGRGTWHAVGSTYTAYSEAEDMNTFTSGTGTVGTGNNTVKQSDGTIGSSSCKLQPLPVGDYVTVKPRGVDGSGTMYYTIIAFPNTGQ